MSFSAAVLRHAEDLVIVFVVHAAGYGARLATMTCAGAEHVVAEGVAGWTSSRTTSSARLVGRARPDRLGGARIEPLADDGEPLDALAREQTTRTRVASPVARRADRSTRGRRPARARGCRARAETSPASRAFRTRAVRRACDRCACGSSRSRPSRTGASRGSRRRGRLPRPIVRQRRGIGVTVRAGDAAPRRPARRAPVAARCFSFH